MKYTIYMEPVAKGRPRVTKFGTYTPKKTRDAEKIIRYAIESIGIEPFDEKAALFLDITFYITRPKSSKRLYPIVKPDLDNLEKLFLDGCSDILRDQQVVSKDSKKLYCANGEPPRIEFEFKIV